MELREKVERLDEALEPFMAEIDRLERDYGFDRPPHQYQPLMLPLRDLLNLRTARASLSTEMNSEGKGAGHADPRLTFRAWLAFCIEQARFNHDALDPRAAEIMTNILEQYNARSNIPALLAENDALAAELARHRTEAEARVAEVESRIIALGRVAAAYEDDNEPHAFDRALDAAYDAGRSAALKPTELSEAKVERELTDSQGSGSVRG